MKIGFACKYHGPKHEAERYNFKTTTLQYLNKLTPEEARSKVHLLAAGNLERLERLIEYVGQLPIELRMLRISTCDLFPFFCSSDYSEGLYGRHLPISFSNYLSLLGDKCRAYGIRVSSHPGQFVFLATESHDHLVRSIFELEKTTEIFQLMGYQGWHPDGLCINIHYGNKDVRYFRWQNNFEQLSLQAKYFLTIENAEYDQYDLHALTDRLGEYVPIVVDLHHYWINSRSYLHPRDQTLREIINSWRGIRPKLHCSMSQQVIQNPYTNREIDLPTSNLPSYTTLIESGLNSALLRKHCNLPWSNPLVEYYSQFTNRFDIMVEMKHKQVAAQELFHKLMLFRADTLNASS